MPRRSQAAPVKPASLLAAIVAYLDDHRPKELADEAREVQEVKEAGKMLYALADEKLLKLAKKARKAGLIEISPGKSFKITRNFRGSKPIWAHAAVRPVEFEILSSPSPKA